MTTNNAGLVCDMADKLKVGMLVETNGNWDAIDQAGLRIRGHIVAMSDGDIYIGTNIDSRTGCGAFLKEASKYGYSKTWQVAKSNNVAWIKILEMPEETKTIRNMLDTRMKELENTLTTSELPMHSHTVVSCCGRLPLSDKGIWDMLPNIQEFNLIPTEENKMSLRYKFKQLFTTEPTKSLKKAGIIDETSFLTSEGGAVLLKWLLDKNIDAFKAEVVDPIIKEMDKE